MKQLYIECADEQAAYEILRFCVSEGPIYTARELPSITDEELGRKAIACYISEWETPFVEVGAAVRKAVLGEGA